MPRLTIEVSETDVEYIDAEIAAGRGRTAAEILAKALTDYRRTRGLEELDRLGREAEASGEAFEVTPEYWARKDREYQARRKASAQ
jgi:hypothetical protein